MKILVMKLDGRMDRDSDVFNEDTQLDLPESVPLKHYPVGGPLDEYKYGTAKLSRVGNEIYAEIQDSKLPESILREFYPGISGSYLDKKGNTITAAKIEAVNFHVHKNADDRIQKIGVQLGKKT